MRIHAPSTSLRGVDVSVVPMINIVFLLLLYFLVAGRLMDTSGPPIALPMGGGARSPAPATVVVHVDATGSLLVGGRVVDDDALTAYLRLHDDQTGIRHILVRADANANATALHAIMRACGAVGVSTFELATVEAR